MKQLIAFSYVQLMHIQDALKMYANSTDVTDFQQQDWNDFFQLQAKIERAIEIYSQAKDIEQARQWLQS